MEDKKVISYKNLPTKLPLGFTALVWMILDKTNAPELIQGIVWTIVGVFWLIAINLIFRQTQVNMFDKEENK